MGRRRRRRRSPFRPSDPRWNAAGYWLAAAWIFGGAIYFYGHFSLLFIQENRAGLEAVLERTRDFLTPG